MRVKRNYKDSTRIRLLKNPPKKALIEGLDFGPSAVVCKQKLANGLTLLFLEDPRVHRASIKIFFKGGVRRESYHNNGITHFLEHMLFRGCKSYPKTCDLEEAFEIIGGTANAYVDLERTCYYTHCHPKFVNSAIEIFKSMFADPLFNDIETEKRIVAQEILEDKNDKGEEINVDNLLYELMFYGSTLSLHIAGNLENLKRFSIKDLEDKLKELLVEENTVIAIHGKVLLNDIQKEVEAIKFSNSLPRLNHITKNPAHLNNDGPKVLIKANHQSQFDVKVGFKAPPWRKLSSHGFPLLQKFLTGTGKSLLPRIMRESMGIVYSIDSGLDMHDEVCIFFVEFSVSREFFKEAYHVLINQLSSLRHKNINMDDFLSAKLACLYDMYFEQDIPEGLVERSIQGCLFDGFLDFSEEYNYILSLSPVSLKRLIEEVIRKDNIYTVAVGPAHGIQKSLEYDIMEYINIAFRGLGV